MRNGGVTGEEAKDRVRDGDDSSRRVTLNIRKIMQEIEEIKE